jgi:hypothetical protein
MLLAKSCQPIMLLVCLDFEDPSGCSGTDDMK